MMLDKRGPTTMRVGFLWLIPLSVSKSVLRNFWIPRHELDLPQCARIQWTCEHVVPKSLIREHGDLHNLILLPARVNHMRSNYKYIEKNNTDYGLVHTGHANQKTIPVCEYCKKCQDNHHGRLISNRLFVPPTMWKGMIARSVLRMCEKYPHHRRLIHSQVLDLNVASMWNYYHPATEDHVIWDDMIQELQGDRNPHTHSFRPLSFSTPPHKK